ncbi:transcription, DNA-dependent [Musa troglodytarum]|nr:transcription, DNA-dependent [Musa troglodytarum]
MNNLPFCWPPPTLPENAVQPVGGGQIGLNLGGHRTYFPPEDGLERTHLFALRSVDAHSPSHALPRCQADGCSADLSGAKYYHRRHKVCEFHFKAAVVVVHGLHQRFCQQCSR